MVSTPNRASYADAVEPAVTMAGDAMTPGTIMVQGSDSPVVKITGDELRTLGSNLIALFGQYRSDRRIQELRWMRNLRQYLGFYDDEIERLLAKDRSRAYPKITRVKCITILAKIMDLMFPSDDRNWTLKARPSADMDIEDVKKAIQVRQQKDAAANGGQPPQLTREYVMNAVTEMAQQRARDLMVEIDDQLQELGGNQTYDYIQLMCEVVASGIMYGLGVLRGPYLRDVNWSTWEWDEKKQQPLVANHTKYMPQYEFMRVWDFYPDLSAKRLDSMDGYFERRVVGKKELRNYAKDDGFLSDQIKTYLRMYPGGNYKPLEFETELRTMGVKANVNEQKLEAHKYQVIIWHGMVDGTMLRAAGCKVSDDKVTDMIDAEIWMLDDYVIKAAINPWVELDVEMKTLHTFLFDEDDTAPIGFGLPNIMRDTQMSISASTRMMLDNASVICGPIVEMNTALLRGDQDLGSLHAYKCFYRDDDGPSTQWPAIREIKVENHIADLERIIELFMKMADIETFTGPTSGGDTSRMPSEPMRNLAGASMLMGAASLPFKQIIRNFDNTTRSIIQSLVLFNRKFNPKHAPAASYDVIARGATSLIAKEVRGIQVDQLASSLKPEEMIHVDTRKLTAARFRVRDLDDMLVSEEEAARRQATQDQATSLDQQLKQQGVEANTRNLLAQAFKNIAQGQANQTRANAEAVNTALAILEKGTGLKPGSLTSMAGAGDGSGGTGGPAPAVGAGPGGQTGPYDPSAAVQPAPGAISGPVGGNGGGGALPPGGM